MFENALLRPCGWQVRSSRKHWPRRKPVPKPKKAASCSRAKLAHSSKEATVPRKVRPLGPPAQAFPSRSRRKPRLCSCASARLGERALGQAATKARFAQSAGCFRRAARPGTWRKFAWVGALAKRFSNLASSPDRNGETDTVNVRTPWSHKSLAFCKVWKLKGGRPELITSKTLSASSRPWLRYACCARLKACAALGKPRAGVML
mmetsp:Transcript_134586/g.287971  ORF Transcript_134586/g.287971 Transcript_134586/m.287971 type:complete len:205 (-) Transcript_134586:2172-2786(-)